MKPHMRNGLIAGTSIGIAFSIITLVSFKPGLLEAPWMIVWVVVSLLCGVGAGLLGGFLVSLVHGRIVSVVSLLVGAIFGLVACYFQLSLFLMVMFRNNPTTF